MHGIYSKWLAGGSTELTPQRILKLPLEGNTGQGRSLMPTITLYFIPLINMLYVGLQLPLTCWGGGTFLAAITW